MSQDKAIRCLTIRSGPARYTAAIYTSQANLSSVLCQSLQSGEQFTTTTEVENFPGFPGGVTDPQLLEQTHQQAERFGTDIRSDEVTRIDFSRHSFEVEIDGSTELAVQAVIIATGARAKYLGLDNGKRYAGMGVSACATYDGFFYRRRHVAVVGDGDTACGGALYLTGIAEQAYLIVHEDHPRASKIMQERLFARENIGVLSEHNTVGLFGDNGVEGAHLVYKKSTPEETKHDVAIDSFFLTIEHKPNTDFLAGQLELDETDYIATRKGRSLTNMERVFTAGDVADPRYRQAITSTGTDCRATLEVEKYLLKEGLQCFVGEAIASPAKLLL